MPQVTYSPAYTLVPTYECFNRCTYCNFRTDPGQSPWLELPEAAQVLRSRQSQGVIEILILSGEVHPHSPRRDAWLQRIYELADLALSWGFLPHTNVGPLSRAEMAQLNQVNVSMGLMLEQMNPALGQTVHRHAPSKVPDLRLQQLSQAGELGIPFTTGLLLGIGETMDDRRETLGAIAQIHQTWGHIQEVILQPYQPGSQEAWSGQPFTIQELRAVIHLARQMLPPDITLQVPPNLIPTSEDLLACLVAGVRDLGGMGARDEVNPDYPYPIDTTLATTLASAGWHLVPRLPVYPQYDDRLPSRLQRRVKHWRSRLKIT